MESTGGPFLFDEAKWLNIASERLARWEEISDDECSFITVSKNVPLEKFNRFMKTYEGHIKLVYQGGDVGFWKLPSDNHSAIGTIIYKHLSGSILEEAFADPVSLMPDRGMFLTDKYGHIHGALQ